MGVPKFYRWISERYPCLSEVITDDQIPEFDNLYLDMNGIIHGCTHGDNDEEISLKLPEEQVFRDIFNYIDALFGIIKPKKVFFMAIDGVAPRAKMNQQRARRFMSAKNAKVALLKAEKKQTNVSKDMLFDSNCITPGTEFMARLHEQLQFFVKMKITTDSRWQGLRIYYSGHNCPGEGEHKIMDFIRSERSRPDYDPDTRHCLYGLDADLIMLGMCSHEPHFSLLREEVKFGRPRRKTFDKVEKPKGPSEITFHLLHLSLLREYLSWEFVSLQNKLPFPFNLDSIIDDWVLMGFLVGNDFIPHLPHVHIHEDALPLLYDTYIKVLPLLDGYMNESGTLNLKRFEMFLREFSKNDMKNFVEMMDDESYMSSKRRPDAWKGRSHGDSEKTGADLEPFAFTGVDEICTGSSKDDNQPGAFDTDNDDDCLVDEETVTCNSLMSASEALESGMLHMNIDSEENSPIVIFDDTDYENDCENYWSPAVDRAFKHHKRDYYNNKMKYANISKDELREQAEGYIRALQWNLHYYYHGCCSWSWFYPHHYAPYISDVVDFSNMEMNFDLNEPFHPFEQLLAVLPAASAECLPVPLQELMLDPSSPIIDFYPEEFKTDLNGKKNDWEAVVLIPFIKEERLLSAVASKESQLSEEERRRNSVGPHLLYTYDPNRADYVQSLLPNTFPNLQRCTAAVQEIDKDEFRISRDRIVHGLLPGVRLDLVFPGFPTMKHIPHRGELHAAEIRVFQQPSKKQSMLLKIQEREEFSKDKQEIASQILETEVHVNWPILVKAFVRELWTPCMRYRKENSEVVGEELDEEGKQNFLEYERQARRREFDRHGICVGQQNDIVLVRLIRSMEYSLSGKSMVPVRYYCKQTVPVSLRLIVQNASEGSDKSPSPLDAFPVDGRVFIKGIESKYYGFEAVIHENRLLKNGTLTLKCNVSPAGTDFLNLKERCSHFSYRWFTAMELARMVHISVDVVNRITGRVIVALDDSKSPRTDLPLRSVNVGLSLKFSKRNRSVADFSRRTAQGFWEYSPKTISLVRNYNDKFPEVFRCLHQTSINEKYIKRDELFASFPPDCRSTRLEELLKYLKDVAPAPGCEYENDTYADSRVIERVLSQLQSVRFGARPFTKRLAVRARAVFRPELCKGDFAPDASTEFRLLDRVVCVKKLPNAPFGGFGTVIGLCLDKKIEVMFDKPFAGGQQIRGANMCCAQVRASSLINLNHGKRVREKNCNEAQMVRNAVPISQRLPFQVHQTSQQYAVIQNNKSKATNTIVAPTGKQQGLVGQVRILARNKVEMQSSSTEALKPVIGNEKAAQSEQLQNGIFPSAPESFGQKIVSETKVITEVSVPVQNDILAKLFVSQLPSSFCPKVPSANIGIESKQQGKHEHKLSTELPKDEKIPSKSNEGEHGSVVLFNGAVSASIEQQGNRIVAESVAASSSRDANEPSAKISNDSQLAHSQRRVRRKQVRGGFCASKPLQNQKVLLRNVGPSQNLQKTQMGNEVNEGMPKNAISGERNFSNKRNPFTSFQRRNNMKKDAFYNNNIRVPKPLRDIRTVRNDSSWGRPPIHLTPTTPSSVAVVRPVARTTHFRMENMMPTQVMRKKMNPTRQCQPKDMNEPFRKNVSNVEKDNTPKKLENTSESLSAILKRRRPRRSRIAANLNNINNVQSSN